MEPQTTNNWTRPAVVVSALALVFFLGTSDGYANLSAIQEKLREAQLKLIRAKILKIQEDIIEAGRPKPVAAEEVVPGPTREELEVQLRGQIALLDQVIASLRPRVIEEEAARIESRIHAINEELKEAAGERVLELQQELRALVADYEALQKEVKAALERSIQARQAIILREQVRMLQEKLATLPREKPIPPEEKQVIGQAIQEEIEKARLKLLREQVKALQEQIRALQNR